MLKQALKAAAVPVALAAAMPAGAAVEMPAGGLVERAVTKLTEQRAAYSQAWYSREHGMLIVSADLGLPAPFDTLSVPDPMLITSSTASILAEPIAWAMMVAGLAAIGWTMRSRMQVTDVSFV